MFDFEYDIIIDHWSERFGITMTNHDRKKLISAFEETAEVYGDELDFDRVCKNACLCRYLNDKYVNLGVCKRVFMIHNLN